MILSHVLVVFWYSYTPTSIKIVRKCLGQQQHMRYFLASLTDPLQGATSLQNLLDV